MPTTATSAAQERDRVSRAEGETPYAAQTGATLVAWGELTLTNEPC